MFFGSMEGDVWLLNAVFEVGNMFDLGQLMSTKL